MDTPGTFVMPMPTKVVLVHSIWLHCCLKATNYLHNLQYKFMYLIFRRLLRSLPKFEQETTDMLNLRHNEITWRIVVKF